MSSKPSLLEFLKAADAEQQFLSASQIKQQGTSQISDVAEDYFFGPLQPIRPVAPSAYRPRQRQYQPGENVIWNPKGDSPISFAVLREFARSFDKLRIVIETFKDMVTFSEWDIRVKWKPGMTNADRKKTSMSDPHVQALKKFFEKPDGVHDFASWMRLWIEDMVVIDAASLYLERDTTGKICNIHPIDGATINRLITDQGFTPPAPSPAYQQVVWGDVVWNFSTDDLVYAMRNERTDSRYGFSAVEQILMTLNIGLRRQQFQLEYYTSGNIPEAMVFLPPGTPPDQVKEFQDSFDAALAGNTAKRRRLTFLPSVGDGNASQSVIFPKEPLLKDEMDTWIMQTICYAIGVSPQPFLRMMNRASAEEATDTSKELGLGPTLAWTASVLNTLIEKMGYTEYEFAWAQRREVDVLKQAQADKIYVETGIRTINEVREALGDDPETKNQYADELGVVSPQNGFIPLGVNNIDQPEGDNTEKPTGKQPEAPAKVAKTATHGRLRQRSSDSSSHVAPVYARRK